MAIVCFSTNGLFIIQRENSSWDYCHKNCQYHSMQSHQSKYLQQSMV